MEWQNYLVCPPGYRARFEAAHMSHDVFHVQRYVRVERCGATENKQTAERVKTQKDPTTKLNPKSMTERRGLRRIRLERWCKFRTSSTLLSERFTD